MAQRLSLVLWGRDKPALDAGVADRDHALLGGVVLAHNVHSPEEVRQVVIAAEQAGATARAIAWACAIRDAVRQIGLEGDLGSIPERSRPTAPTSPGIAVHIGQRVSSLAQPGEVLVSRTVVDLVLKQLRPPERVSGYPHGPEDLTGWKRSRSLPFPGSGPAV